jgi:hypothetical protein
VSSPAAREADLANARRLVEEIRRELDPIEKEIRRHPYLAALEAGHVHREDLARFAGEQHHIICTVGMDDGRLQAYEPAPGAHAYTALRAHRQGHRLLRPLHRSSG